MRESDFVRFLSGDECGNLLDAVTHQNPQAEGSGKSWQALPIYVMVREGGSKPWQR
jgi:hypothetical protein